MNKTQIMGVLLAVFGLLGLILLAPGQEEIRNGVAAFFAAIATFGAWLVVHESETKALEKRFSSIGESETHFRWLSSASDPKPKPKPKQAESHTLKVRRDWVKQ